MTGIDLQFDNRFTSELAADPSEENAVRPVHRAHFSRVQPEPAPSPAIVAVSDEMCDLLGIDAHARTSDEFAQVFSGSRLPAGADPFAMAYAGHQFGVWAGQLGDGRAIALGEVIDTRGEHQLLQLKGAGPTPYARMADGRAVLRSSLREFLCSEAMHHLGIPTTRALSLVLTGRSVVRDMFYDGNPEPEPGAVVCRVAPSFTRFGSFQLFASRGELDELQQLVDYTVRNDFPHLWTGESVDAATVGAMFHEVCERTARLLVDWMRVGFVHGVLNTDNMSITGLTIDYGPYGWLEDFDLRWTPNTTDADRRRYAYGAQPQMAQWNLLQLANALLQLTGDKQPLEAGLERYAQLFEDEHLQMLTARVGWDTPREGDADLLSAMFLQLGKTETDQVLFYRDLAQVPTDESATDDDLLAPLADCFYQPDEMIEDVRASWVSWLRSWAGRVRAAKRDDDTRRSQMNALNPRFVLRNYLAQQAIDAATDGDYSLTHELLDTLRRPYDEQPGRERFAARRPEWARHRPGSSMLSCSS